MVNLLSGSRYQSWRRFWEKPGPPSWPDRWWRWTASLMRALCWAPCWPLT